MKTILTISILAVCSCLKTATAQNAGNFADSTCSQKTNNIANYSQLLASCHDTDTATTKGIARKETRKILEERKRKYFTHEINLTEDEAKVFFPVLNQFESKHRQIGRERKKLFADFEKNKNTITDKDAKQINKQFLDLKNQEVELLAEYQKIFETILSPKKVLLFYKANENFKRGLLKSIGGKNKKNQVNTLQKNNKM